MTDSKNTARKSQSAFKTIGEVAEEMDLPTHVLRFWESKFTEIKPKKRRGGHRYYRPQDIETLYEIKHLLYDKGYTIKGAQKFFKEKKLLEDTAKQASEPRTASTPQATHDPIRLDLPKQNDLTDDQIRHICNELDEINQILS